VALILDTNAVSALIQGDEGVSRVVSGLRRHHLPLPVIAEYQFGLLSLRNPQRLQSLFRRLEADSYVVAPDRGTADWYAAIRHDLRQRGQPIPDNDLWIAALARQHDLEVVSRDPHFDCVDKLKRLSW
jgi:predicted nucleic acid-binding protein